MSPPRWFMLGASLVLVPATAAAAGEARGPDMMPILATLVIMLLGARIGGSLAERLGMPAVLGELAAGILIGNLGLVGFHGFEGIADLDAIQVLAQIGVLFLLFSVGLESNLSQMMKVGASSLLVATLGVVAPMLLGLGVSRWFFPAHHSLTHWFVGATLCATSVGIAARVLTDLGRATSTEGRIILGAAVIDDVLGLIVLAVVGGVISAADRGLAFQPLSMVAILAKSLVFLAGALVLGRWLSPQVFKLATRLRGERTLLPITLAMCFGLAWLAGLAGLAPIVGAFAGGLILEEGHYEGLRGRDRDGRTIPQLLEPLETFLVPLFFVLMGMQVDLRVFGSTEVLGFAAVLTFAAVLGKQACAFGVLESGADRLAVGLGMIPRGEVGLIFASIGTTLRIHGVRVVDSTVFSAVVIMVAITTLLTPPLLVWRMRARPGAAGPGAAGPGAPGRQARPRGEGAGLMRRARPIATALALAALGILAAGRADAESPAPAPPYARFDVPDSLLKGAVAASAGEFEGVWNALFVAELRAISGSKNALVTESAAHLLMLLRRVAAAEKDTLGTHIGEDALALRFHWMPSERDQRIEAAVAESLAAVAQGQRQNDRAESQFRSALSLYRKLAERRREAWVVGSLGVLAYGRGDLTRADSIYREALLLRRRLEDPRLIGNTLNALGITNQQMRRPAVAYDYFQEARAVREGLGDRSALVNTLNLLGLTAFQLGQPDSSRFWYDQALALAVSSGDSARAAEVLINEGLLMSAGGERAAASSQFERARAIARARGDLRLEAGIERATADMRRRQGRFTDAAEGQRRTIALDERLGEAGILTQDLITLGRIAVTVRDPALGRAPLARARALADSLRSPLLQSQALDQLAALAGIDGDAPGAERLGTQALAAGVAAGDSVAVHDAAAALGERSAGLGDMKAARPWFERALAAGRALPDEERVGDHHNLARAALAAGRLDEAERQEKTALDLAERAGAPEAGCPALLGLAELAERRRDFAKALAYDRRSASLIDTLRAEPWAEAPSITALGRRLSSFEALIRLLGQLEPRFPDSGYAAEAFRWAERARARAFLDQLEGAAARAGAGPPARAPAASAPSLKDARALLESDREALIEYSVGDSSTSLWVITRRATRRLTLPPRALLRERAEAFRRGLGDASGAARRSTLGASHDLYTALIGPVEKDLAGVSRLIVSADDALAFVPFEALLCTDLPAANDAPAPGSYLIERFAISYVPSTAALASLRGPGRAGVVVALGDPLYGGDSGEDGAPALAPLPGSAAEIVALRGLSGSRRFVALTGAQATRERLLALPELREAGLIHLATRGVADEREPGRSGLWLAAEAAAGAAPGFLGADDVISLRLRADLVTLSACETGMGRLERGEGLLGLTRAFLAAGARTVIVSLWNVNGSSTATILESFYRALLERGLAREDALAAAKRELLAAPETRSPYFWAPLVMSGGGGKLR